MNDIKVSQRTLIMIALFVWLSGGIALVLKGGALIKSAYVIDPRSLWTVS